ncbi:ABC transporter ATP-binding protein [Leucobacter komagatae]|uniref:ABC transporter n=1 Tax=Leucobacter komagatae TaxID=55969 RepID=A0A0D0IRJ9_9MICO|nr:ATP-binding cassette domain-containing protein [Leucobacter komagatae]KIP53597.1 ABC transporter [Leucobacter komagatae]
MQVAMVDLEHHFANHPSLFTGLTMTLVSGHVYALTGPSGSGKSTLLGILAGWTTPSSGTVVHTGIEAIGWVFQNPHGVAARTALDHVALPLLAQGEKRSDAEKHASTYLARFNLTYAANRAFKELSGGEAQRLMLARAIAAAPSLLLVDEPTAQLDPRTAATVNQTLGAIADDGTIVVVATHDQRTREACTDVIDLGEYT